LADNGNDNAVRCATADAAGPKAPDRNEGSCLDGHPLLLRVTALYPRRVAVEAPHVRLPGHRILMYMLTYDFICEFYSLRDDDLAGRVGLNVKDLNRMMATLVSHRLVQA
jgi:hypothetical protein